MQRPIKDEAIEFWTNVMVNPDPKVFEQKNNKRAMRPMAMRWGSANVLTLHETLGSDVVREKGLSASARRLDLEAQFNASGYGIIGLQETRCRREGDRRGRHYYMIGTAASDIGQGGCELWITLKLKPGKSSITVTAQSHRWLAVNVELPKFSAAIVVAHAPPEVANELVRKQWWEELSQIVLGMAPRSGQVWLLIDANGRLGSHTSVAVGSCHAQTQNGNGKALHSLLLEAGLFATNTFTQEGKATWFATSGHASRIDYVCAPQDLSSALSRAGTCEEVLLETGGRVDHLPVFADFSIQPLQGTRSVQRKKCICDVRKARYDNDAIQRFEAAIALAPAVPLTFEVDQHAELLARFIRQTAAESFPKEMARRKKDWISDDTWKLILAKKPILMEQRKARAWLDLCCLWKAWVAWTDPNAAVSRVTEASWTIAANLRTIALQRYKVAEFTDQVRKAVRKDWCAYVDTQALEAQSAALGHNSEQLYQVVKNLARKQSKGFRCTRIRLEDGTLASQYEEAQARWLRFHAGNYGAKIQSQQEYNATLLRHRLNKLPHETNSLTSFQYMMWHQDFRDILSRLKNRKAAGEDCIPNEVLKAGGHAMAAQLGDLALKVWQQQDTPMAWRGGVMVTVPKKGPQDLCASHRGVLTASTMGKTYAKKLRAELLPFLESRVHSSQYGGLPARNTEMATHHARTIMLKAKREKMACAALFMDVKNAFPSLAHVMVFGEQNLERRVAKVDCLVQELPELYRPREKDLILQWLDGASALQRLGVPAKLIARLEDWHTQSFVVVEGDARVASCAKGTRPGDPLADIIFNVAMHAALDMFAKERPTNPHISYVDDTTAFVTHNCPKKLLHEVDSTLVAMRTALAKFGLHLNMGPKKTEVMLMLRGKGTQEARRSLTADQGVTCIVLNDGTLLRTCQSYRHLGVILSRTEHMGPEVAARIKNMHVHYHPLAPNVFLNEHLSEEVKSSLANSLLWSVLLQGAGTWGPIGHCWIKKLEAARVYVLRAMGRNFRGASEGVMTDAQVLCKAGLLPVQLQLRIERIKFAARLFGKAPEELRRLATSEDVNDTDTWYGLLSQDLQHMTNVMNKELAAMPRYSSQPDQWHKLWADFPGAWKLLVKRFAQRLRESCNSVHEIERAEDTQFVHASSDLEGVHTCANCGNQFASNCGLAVHIARVHGVRRPAPSYAKRDGTCASCKRCFHNRVRLVHHLSYSSSKCLQWCILHMEPLPDHDREVLDREDADKRRRDKREGRSFLATDMPFVLQN